MHTLKSRRNKYGVHFEVYLMALFCGFAQCRPLSDGICRGRGGLLFATVFCVVVAPGRGSHFFVKAHRRRETEKGGGILVFCV